MTALGFFPGPFELLIIAMMVGAPVVTVFVVLWLVRRETRPSQASRDQDPWGPRPPDAEPVDAQVVEEPGRQQREAE